MAIRKEIYQYLDTAHGNDYFIFQLFTNVSINMYRHYAKFREVVGWNCALMTITSRHGVVKYAMWLETQFWIDIFSYIFNENREFLQCLAFSQCNFAQKNWSWPLCNHWKLNKLVKNCRFDWVCVKLLMNLFIALKK